MDAATDGSARTSRPASDDGPYEPTTLGAGVLLVRPGAFLDDPALLIPDFLVRDDQSLAPPPRHNDDSTRPPYVHMHRGHSDRANHYCGHSLRILGEPMSVRAELGGIHFALERTPVDEELTILTDSLKKTGYFIAETAKGYEPLLRLLASRPGRADVDASRARRHPLCPREDSRRREAYHIN